MKFFAAIMLVAVLVAAASAQTETKFVIDDFNTRQTINLVSTGAIPDEVPPENEVSFELLTEGNTLLGGERDISVTINECIGVNSIISTTCRTGEWVTGVFTSTIGLVSAQWDGVDNSISLDTSGLGGVDFTANSGSEIFVALRTDKPATYVLTVYSTDGNSCEASLDVSSTVESNEYSLEFSSDFSGNCDFSSVGALEVDADGGDGIDSAMTAFEVRGEAIPTPSPNPSATRTPAASASSTPQASPAVVVEDCHCQCPAFTCELIFDPDDDENNAYYFDDDDDNRNAVAASSSDASALKVSVTAGLVLALAALL